jgi:hypothetical protein
MTRRLAVGVFLLTVAMGLGALQPKIERANPSAFAVDNAEGEPGTARLLHHPSLSDRQLEPTNAFAEAPLTADWRVERTTAARHEVDA